MPGLPQAGPEHRRMARAPRPTWPVPLVPSRRPSRPLGQRRLCPAVAQVARSCPYRRCAVDGAARRLPSRAVPKGFRARPATSATRVRAERVGPRHGVNETCRSGRHPDTICMDIDMERSAARSTAGLACVGHTNITPFLFVRGLGPAISIASLRGWPRGCTNGPPRLCLRHGPKCTKRIVHRARPPGKGHDCFKSPAVDCPAPVRPTAGACGFPFDSLNGPSRLQSDVPPHPDTPRTQLGQTRHTNIDGRPRWATAQTQCVRANLAGSGAETNLHDGADTNHGRTSDDRLRVATAV